MITDIKRHTIKLKTTVFLEESVIYYILLLLLLLLYNYALFH